MIKLKNLLKEEQFTARAKDSGKLVYFKSKDSRDTAIKQGTHTDPEKETKPQQQTTQKPAGADLFGKDYQTARGGDKPKEAPTKQSKPNGMETVKAIASQTGLRAQAVAGWADENGVNLSKVGDDLKSKKLKPMDLMTAVSGNPNNKYAKQIISKYSNKDNTAQSTTSIKSLMPNADFKKKTLDDVDPLDKQKISMTIDKLAKMGEEAKAKGEKAPNYNLCQVTIPGTNLYCDGNKGISRADMPQFKGVPEKGSPADKLPKDNNGEADTEEFFKEMLNKKGIKVSEPVSVKPDRLKATQSELVGVKVAGMSKILADKNHPAYNKITAPIYVSNDGYVLDGHHRWAAVVAHNAANPNSQIPMQVRVIDEPIVPLVKRSNDFAEQIGIRAKAADTGAAGGKVESVDEAQMHAQTQRVSLDAIRQLKVNLKQEKDLMKLLDLLDKKIRKYEPW